MTLAGADSLSVLMVMLFLAFACLGLVIPATMVLSLEEHGPIAGMASALGGTLQMVAGGIMIVVVSLSFDGTALPMVTIIALSAVGAFILTRLTLRREELAAEPAENRGRISVSGVIRLPTRRPHRLSAEYGRRRPIPPYAAAGESPCPTVSLAISRRRWPCSASSPRSFSSMAAW